MAKSRQATQIVILNRMKYLASDKKGKGEENTEPSQTIPNQAMSIQEMVNKFTISSEWPKIFPEQHDTPETLGLPDITRMDKIEIQKLANETKQEIDLHQSQLRMLQEEEYQKVQEQNAALKLAAQQAQQQTTNDQNNPNS